MIAGKLHTRVNRFGIGTRSGRDTPGIGGGTVDGDRGTRRGPQRCRNRVDPREGNTVFLSVRLLKTRRTLGFTRQDVRRGVDLSPGTSF